MNSLTTLGLLFGVGLVILAAGLMFFFALPGRSRSKRQQAARSRVALRPIRAMQRLRRALQDFAIAGIQTNLPLFQRILDDPDFIEGRYDTSFLRRPLSEAQPQATDELLHDLAVIAAVAYQMRLQSQQPMMPDRLLEGWHHSGRQLPG